MCELDVDWYVGLVLNVFQCLCDCGFGGVVVQFDIVVCDVFFGNDCVCFDYQQCGVGQCQVVEMDLVLVGYVVIDCGILVYWCDYDVIGEIEFVDFCWGEQCGVVYVVIFWLVVVDCMLVVGWIMIVFGNGNVMIML